jgi:hypothetical protein
MKLRKTNSQHQEESMDQKQSQPEQQPVESERSSRSEVPKNPWVEPRLAFVEPKLTKHGALTEVTGQFFGAFSPADELD